MVTWIKMAAIYHRFQKLYNNGLWRLERLGFILSRGTSTIPQLSHQQINRILRKNDRMEKVQVEWVGPVKDFNSSHLAANVPLEDRYFGAFSPMLNVWLFGMVDGHHGSQCADLVKTLLPHYLIAALMQRRKLIDNIDNIFSNEFCTFFIDGEIHKRQLEQHATWIQNHIESLIDTVATSNHPNITKALKNAFEQLDLDISDHVQELLPVEASEKYEDVKSLFTGCCACVAYFDGINLHIANSGDCRAILVCKSDTRSPSPSASSGHSWSVKKLSELQNSSNTKEVARILSEHPVDERKTLFKSDRLFGSLIPLRGFGDFIYKWHPDVLQKMLQHHIHLIPENYATPPYLTVSPEISHHCLSPKDIALVLASDGLWDMLTPSLVATLVGEHVQGRQSVEVYDPATYGHTLLSQISKILNDRRQGLTTKSEDENAATHLIRNALGYTAMGIDENRISSMLSLPEDMVRHFRDDISVIVIHLNPEYINHPDLIGTGFAGQTA